MTEGSKSNRTVAHYDADPAAYDDLHSDDATHLRALERAWPIIKGHSMASVLDVGCGTGRSLQWFGQHQPDLRLLGIDPSAGLLTRARARLPNAEFALSAGEQLPFETNSVDLVFATGIMHHVDRPSDVIAEMFRVARYAVLISDHNNFAFNNNLTRRVRIGLYVCGLLPLFTFIKQGFKRQGYSEEDGWWYPYSLLDNAADIAVHSDIQYWIPTRHPNTNKMNNFMFVHSHFAVFALKRSVETGASLDDFQQPQ